MRLWAEERKSGTIELLMTLPVSTTQAVVGKFIAAWVFAGIALALTFPIWITVNYLGSPDNGVIIAGYVASFLMAGAFLAIGSFVSAMTRNQVIAFVITAAVCFLFMMSYRRSGRVAQLPDKLRRDYPRRLRSSRFHLHGVGYRRLPVRECRDRRPQERVMRTHHGK